MTCLLGGSVSLTDRSLQRGAPYMVLCVSTTCSRSQAVLCCAFDTPELCGVAPRACAHVFSGYARVLVLPNTKYVCTCIHTYCTPLRVHYNSFRPYILPLRYRAA